MAGATLEFDAAGALVFPAPAGMNRDCREAFCPRYGVPRASGDEPEYGSLREQGLPCSPRQRG